MPYKVRVIKTKVKDTDGLDISFDLLGGNYEKATLDDQTPAEGEEEGGKGGEGG